ncbi:hypothetical protein FS837_002306 [Tulasnella sp. UAMH 9824]|nr:hypothetical protein FS837_002306 [Tulasnella sp. UAMH 9824]
MGDHPPKSSTPASATGANHHPAPTPRPSSNNVIPNSSPSNPNESPESNNTNPSNPAAASPSPTSPTSPMGTGPSARGHHRIGSSSTNTSNYYPSWLPRRPPPPEPPGSTAGGMTTRPSTRAGFDSPDDDMGEFDWELVVGPEAAREEALNSSEGEDVPRTSREQRRHTLSGLPTAAPSQPIAPKGERKPTPRSVRIVSVPGGSHQQGPSNRTRDTSEATTRVPSGSAAPPVGSSGSRAFSRATGSALVSPTLISSFPSRGGTAGAKNRYSRTGRSSTLPPMAIHMMQNPGAAAVQPTPMGAHPIQHLRPPRFRTPKFHPTLLRDPSPLTRLRFYLWGLFVVFGHIILQSFLDFNVVYMMIQVAKHPTPSPLGTSSSQRNWTLATVAYIASWAIWLFGVVLLYEKRPLVIPIYLSSAAFNLVSLTSYTNFCFLQHIRWSALGEYNTVTDESELGSLARRKPVEKPAQQEQQHQAEGDDGEGHRIEQSPVEQHRQSGGALEAEHADNGAEPRGENPNSESSISYATPSNNGNGAGSDPHQSTPESAKRNSTGGGNGNGKHQRQFSQARTVSSAPSKGRFSEGVESSDGLALSEGRPQISELASDHEDEEEIVSAVDAKRQRAEDLHRPTETAIPLPRSRAIRGADGSAFFEHRMSYSSTVSSSSSVGSSRFGGRNALQFLAESCWFYSQNMPTIVTLLPRLALTLALYLAFVGPSTGATLGSNNSLGRDGTFFGGHGELSGYAKVIVWLQIAWGLWRTMVLLGSWIGLWMLSGLGCAGLCGPRYRWEEMPAGLEDEDSPLPYLRRDEEKRRETMLAASGDEQREPHAYNSRRHSRLAENRLSSLTVADPRYSDRTGRRAFSDPDDHTLNWSWMERCRDRIWDTWEFCLTRSNNVHRGDQHDAYWHAWRSAGVAPTADADHLAREMSEKQPGSVPVAGASGLAPASPGYNSSMPAVGTPIPFSSLTASSAGYGAMGLPAYQPGAGGYGQMDTMLSTLQEMSSNPSLAPSSAQAGVSPVTVPQPLPIFSTPQAPRRGILTQELFSGPLPDTTAMHAKPDDGAWLGSSAVPLAGPQSGAPTTLPYPFPAYSSSQQSPKTTLPFPLAPVVVANEQSVIQVPPQSRHPANVFPTPAPTIQSLPFPAPRSGASSVGMSPGQQPQEELVEYYDDAEHGVLSHVRSQIGSQGTGSMSSLGQPIQSRYPVGYRRPRGRRSSASASGSGVTGSHRMSDASVPALGSQQRSPRDSFISGSGSGSGYGSQAMVRSQRSRISGASSGYLEGEAYYAEEESLGSRMSSPVGPGMAGVGAGGGLGPRGSLLNLGSQPQSPLEEYALDPPPRHPSGGRRRAGTLPSSSAPDFVPPPIVPPVSGTVGSVRGRLISAPSQPSSSTREYFAPIPGHDLDMPAFAQALGLDDDEEFGGSQEEAELEDSVGLLSQAPSRRSSASGLNLRSRASQISLHRRGNTSRPVSVTSPTHLSAGGVRSRTTSLINRQAAESRESLHSGSRGSLAVPEARSRTGSDAGPSDRRTSQYSDARSRTHSGTGSHLEGSVESAGPGPGHDMTFGVQVDWQRPEASAMAEAQGESSATNLRTSGPGLASTSRASLQVPGTRSRPIDINAPAGSGPDLSSANASLVTALPSVAASTTDTVGISEGSSERTWERGRSNRYFLEGNPGAVGPR